MLLDEMEQRMMMMMRRGETVQSVGEQAKGLMGECFRQGLVSTRRGTDNRRGEDEEEGRRAGGGGGGGGGWLAGWLTG
jgi:hypothetical protein